jgi:hypothetical protein
VRRVETPIEIIDSIGLAGNITEQLWLQKCRSAPVRRRAITTSSSVASARTITLPQHSVLAIGIPRSAPDGGDGGLTESGTEPAVTLRA